MISPCTAAGISGAVRQSFRRAQPHLSQRSGDGGQAAVHPITAPRLREHDLQCPRRIRRRTAPDAVDLVIEWLARRPGLEHGVCRRVEVPSRETPAHLNLIAAQHLDIEVGVVARLPSGEKIERPATRDPPRRAQGAEQRRGLLWTHGLPRSVLRCCRARKVRHGRPTASCGARRRRPGSWCR